MEPIRPHPSFLEIDRASLGHPSAEIHAHVASCPRCAVHYRRVTQREAVPSWVNERRRRSIPVRLTDALRRWRVTWLVGAALVTASLVVVVLHPQEGTHRALVTAKGAPSLAVFVKRGDQITLWDGHSPVAPGDQLRLRVTPEGFRHVLVLTAIDSATPAILYSGALPGAGTAFLPSAWIVDALPGPEEIAVILSHDELSRSQGDGALRGMERSSKIWTTRLFFPKARSLQENGR